MREIRLSGSEGGGTGNSTGPPYPYPTSTVVGGRNWPWPRWWGGCGGWWWWRTLERPGWRSHAGAWERSENDQHDQKDQHDQRGGTIDDQNGAHGAAYVGPGVGCRGQRGGVGQGRGGVLGKQERPGSGGCRAGWDAGVRRGDQAWVLRRRATAARPARPVPKSSMVAGSGTGAAILKSSSAVWPKAV